MRNEICPSVRALKGGMPWVITRKDWQKGQTTMKPTWDMINPEMGYAPVEER